MKYKLLAKSSVLAVLLSLTLISLGFAAGGDGGGGVWAERRAAGGGSDVADEFQSPPSEMRALVEPGKMTERQFHDAVLKENAIPIELIRADFMYEKLTRDYEPNWKFYGELSAKQ